MTERRKVKKTVRLTAREYEQHCELVDLFQCNWSELARLAVNAQVQKRKKVKPKKRKGAPEGLAVHLRACVYCQNKPLRVRREIGDTGIMFVVECRECGAIEFPFAKSVEALVKAWNSGGKP